VDLCHSLLAMWQGLNKIAVVLSLPSHMPVPPDDLDHKLLHSDQVLAMPILTSTKSAIQPPWQLTQAMPMVTIMNHLAVQDSLDEPAAGIPNCSLIALIFSQFCQEILIPMDHIIQKHDNLIDHVTHIAEMGKECRQILDHLVIRM